MENLQFGPRYCETPDPIGGAFRSSPGTRISASSSASSVSPALCGRPPRAPRLAALRPLRPVGRQRGGQRALARPADPLGAGPRRPARHPTSCPLRRAPVGPPRRAAVAGGGGRPGAGPAARRRPAFSPWTCRPAAAWRSAASSSLPPHAVCWLIVRTVRLSPAAALSGGAALALALGALTFPLDRPPRLRSPRQVPHFLWHILLSSAAFTLVLTLIRLNDTGAPLGRPGSRPVRV